MNDFLEDDLYCKLCSHTYDETNYIPLILPDCGHTFCSSCIRKKLENLYPEETFMCPEDK